MTEHERESSVRKKYEQLTRALIAKNLTITTMESCTGGQIISLITDTEGASAVVKGAYVTYCNEAKIMQGVPAEVIDGCGVYSEETAAAMADACRKNYRASIGVGVTGTFGNADPENADSIPGEAYYAVSTEHMTEKHRCTLPVQHSRSACKMVLADLVVSDLLRIISDD